MTLSDKSKHPIKAAKYIKTKVKSTINSAAATTVAATVATTVTKIKTYTHEPEELEETVTATKLSSQTVRHDNTRSFDTNVDNVNESSNIVEQRCVLIPSYGFRKKNEQGKEEWNIKVKGWAYANGRGRKRKMLLDVARRVVGIADNSEKRKVLEDRFEMFLTKNLRNLLYNIKVVGIAHPLHMEFYFDFHDGDTQEKSDSNDSYVSVSPSSDENNSDEEEIIEAMKRIGDELLASENEVSEANDVDVDDNKESDKKKKKEKEINKENSETNNDITVTDNNDNSKLGKDDDQVEGESFAFPIQIKKNNGHFSETIKIPVEVVDKWAMESHETNVRLLKLLMEPRGTLNSDNNKPYYGIANLIDTEGISVISDIDDTIKYTGITDGTRTILSNTFLNELKEVDGMAEVYNEWYHKGASFHYVSNSPWQLFPMLKKFFHTKNFPPGSAHLKFYDDIMKTLLLEERGESKRNYIEEILQDFPKRKFILVGDSGEVDMEIYTNIARNYPERILHIFIRDVTTDFLNKKYTKLQSKQASKSKNSLSKSKKSMSLSSSSSSSNDSEYENVSINSNTTSDHNDISSLSLSPTSSLSSTTHNFGSPLSEVSTTTSFSSTNSNNETPLTDDYFVYKDIHQSSSPNITPITPMTPLSTPSITPDKPSSSLSSAAASTTITAAAAAAAAIVAEYKLALQQFKEKASYFHHLTPNKAFRLFKDSKELIENEIVNAAFRKYNK